MGRCQESLGGAEGGVEQDCDHIHTVSMCDIEELIKK